MLPVLLSGLGHGHDVVVADEQQGQQAGVGALPFDQHAVLAGTNLWTRAQGVGWRQGAGVQGAGSRAQGAGVKGWRALGSGRRVQGGGGVVRMAIVTICEVLETCKGQAKRAVWISVDRPATARHGAPALVLQPCSPPNSHQTHAPQAAPLTISTSQADHTAGYAVGR